MANLCTFFSFVKFIEARGNMLRKKGARGCSGHADALAVAYCTNCKKFFCEQCKKEHNASHGYRHEIVPVGMPSDLDLLDGRCPEHTDWLSLMFCMDCNGNT